MTMFQDEVKVYRDVSGTSLHRRGYRAGGAIHKAALNEAAAAGVLYLAGWPEAAEQGTAALAAGLLCQDLYKEGWLPLREFSQATNSFLVQGGRWWTACVAAGHFCWRLH